MTARQNAPQSHRDLDGQSLPASAGSLLVPQPKGPSQASALDCCENEDGTEFCFHEGNEMEGHYLVYGPIKAPAGLVPEYDWNLEVWTWQPRTKPTYRQWLEAQPWYKANDLAQAPEKQPETERKAAVGLSRLCTACDEGYERGGNGENRRHLEIMQRNALICEECGTSDPEKEVLESGVFVNGGVCPKARDTWHQPITICRDCDSHYNNCEECGASMTDYAFAASEKCPRCKTPKND